MLSFPNKKVHKVVSKCTISSYNKVLARFGYTISPDATLTYGIESHRLMFSVGVKGRVSICLLHLRPSHMLPPQLFLQFHDMPYRHRPPVHPYSTRVDYSLPESKTIKQISILSKYPYIYFSHILQRLVVSKLLSGQYSLYFRNNKNKSLFVYKSETAVAIKRFHPF